MRTRISDSTLKSVIITDKLAHRIGFPGPTDDDALTPLRRGKSRRTDSFRMAMLRTVVLSACDAMVQP
eukprot:COSAG02_NODE_31164_length_538_cov_1.004556_2_plen_67_part_01